MRRRRFLGIAMAVANASPLFGTLCDGRWDDAAKLLEWATAAKQVHPGEKRKLPRRISSGFWTSSFGLAAKSFPRELALRDLSGSGGRSPLIPVAAQPLQICL